MKATGYFAPATAFHGFITWPYTVSPLAPLNENCSYSPKRTSAKACSFRWVNWVKLPLVPRLNSWAPDVRLAWLITTVSPATSNAPT